MLNKNILFVIFLILLIVGLYATALCMISNIINQTINQTAQIFYQEIYNAGM